MSDTLDRTEYEWRALETADGPVLRYRDYPGAPARPPVLMLHGLTRNSRDFQELAPLVAEATGRRVIVPEMRGRGRSDPDPDPARYDYAVYVADVAALLDRLGVRKAVWVGTSMGGLITMVSAFQTPERVTAVVLNDIGPELADIGLKRIQSYVGGDPGPAKDWAEAAARVRGINETAFPGRDEAFWEDFARRLYRVEDEGLVLDYDFAISANVTRGDAAPPDLWPVYEALKPIPALLVRGAVTDLLANSTVERMKAIKPDLKVVEAENVGHAPFMTEPDVWPHLKDFLCSLDC